MARTTATVSFQALELKGSLLPASLLEEVSKLARPKELLLESKDYGLGKGEGLRERIDAAWVLTKELWEEYTDLSDRAGKSIAGQHFGTRLLKEVFGWRSTQPCNGWQQGESHYPINARAFDGAVPVILRGLDADDLDRGSAQFGQEGRKRSPHSCLQECLNADDDANWGVLLSGDRLRLLHDNPSLVKPAYLAADLELLIEGGLHAEFAVLWLLLHSSRFQHPQTGSCVLDDWKQQAEASGERVLGALRGGVQSALESLGWGFLNHPSNGELREALQSGQLSRQQFHEQLLRLVYRFLFLFTTEDRNLLFSREVDKTDARRRIYQEGYSVSRLRELAIKRSAYEGEYGDLWELQRLVFQQLSIGNSPLGLPGLGGLFSLEQCPDLQDAELWNGPLLRAIKAIGWFDADGSFTRVRYRDLNTEELGSVYEGLLELHPQLEQQGNQWQLNYGGGAGSDRKTTGSYYTPDALVQELIKSALIPVIDDRLSKAHGPAVQEQALLKIKVIDPACGSGHFLLAAARRLAVALAQVRAGDDQPSEDDRQHALRDVVAHCIYAVDKNPMAVELCKVALWIEAIDPGKPLSFLDAHIQCGDSLVGVFDPKVLEEGIPDGAYKPLTGDNKTVCTSLKKENAAARKTISRRGSNRGIQGSLALSSTQPRSQGGQVLQAIEAMPETTLAETAAKQAAYAQWLSDRGQDPEALAADLYTAAFFLAKTSDSRSTVPTTEHLLKLLAGQPVDEAMEEAVVEAAQNFRFFHWHLRFGEVMEQGGFDCVLGNPPWEKTKVQEKEFFANLIPSISEEGNKSARNKMIELLSQREDAKDRAIYSSYINAKKFSESLSEFSKHSDRYNLISGETNLYTLFCETAIRLKSNSKSSTGLIMPSGIIADDSNKKFAQYFIESGELRLLADFINKLRIFRDVVPNQQFCLITLSAVGKSGCKISARMQSTEELNQAFEISKEEIALINPNTLNIPAMSGAAQKKMLVNIYRNSCHLCAESENARPSFWKIEFASMFHMSNDSSLFLTEEEVRRSEPSHFLEDWSGEIQGKKITPLYEAKLVDAFNHKCTTFEGADRNKMFGTKPKTLPASNQQLTDAKWHSKPRYWVSKNEVENRIPTNWKFPWIVGFRNALSSSADSRSLRATIIPRHGAGNSLPLIFEYSGKKECLTLVGFLNSIVMDYVIKQKVSGANLNFYIIKQLPIPNLKNLTNEDLDYISSRVERLSFSSSCFAEEEAFISGAACTDSPSRAETKAELDAYTAKLFGLDKGELDFIFWDKNECKNTSQSATFEVLRSIEIKEFGEYRSRRLALEAWDRIFGR
ncbi:hypothetical protein WB44_01215 [Synechococcus sp. WH 8020]|uniref:Eco57I restriction-modification methylase domain-containing protein n=1 Tax=Synechococcus sp. (strain WH8020) TaxID=32052 RepID=UPI0006527B24|nr:N-6 DNA methylase [Synechococcus sp. WH 8020]AKN59972.1 hypothetical protein WB44_01215 [Synechococcus sp. WH 8020]